MPEALLYILYGLAGVLALLIAVVLVRTFTFRPKTSKKEIDTAPVSFDGDAAVCALQKLLQCKTISYHDQSLEQEAEFQKLIDLLPELYPEVYRACELQALPDRALLFRWAGKKQGAPAVMMSHYDVVPVEESAWQKPPFSGIIEDGVLWGRGALDTKVTMNAVLFAANHMIKEGYVPENDIYFAFSGGEEINGPGALHIVNYFKERGITPALVVDEGGGVVEKVFPGVKKPCALVGIAEKGMLNLTLSMESNGGHASAPKPHTPIGHLSRAVCKVEDHPFPMHTTKPVKEMFDTLGRHSTFLFRMIFANLWLFGWVLKPICAKGGDLNALLRTTVAFTQSEGSSAPNVIPPKASVTANLRLNPADSVQGAVDRISKLIGNEQIKPVVGYHVEPSRISQTHCDAWDKIVSAVGGTWQGSVVSPYLMMQCSDSRHWGAISDHVYRFSAMDLTAEERRTIHGHDERIRLDCLKRSVEFYIRLMRQC
ncbi:MAG: M20/M25/M40 family metallo-hydrolase [Ruminococcaceae bacterium]|nr:M20/M25/M40 family metallo-hydrolase [Oscillospiraceae bacterium]